MWPRWDFFLSFKLFNQIPRLDVAPMGFEPTTPGLKVQCSNQTELRSH